MAAPPDDDMLREAARARGFRLVKSRRRKPGGDFGRYGLVGLDSGRQCLGFGDDGLTATADEILAYLRGGEIASWKRSLIGVVDTQLEDDPPTTRPKSTTNNPARPERSRGASIEPPPPLENRPSRTEDRTAPSPSAKARRGVRWPSAEKRVPSQPSPENFPPALAGGVGGGPSSPPRDQEPPTIREATRRDAAALAKLLDLPAATLAERIAAAIRADEPPLVADRGGPIGLVAWTIVPTLQYGPRGRVTLLFVAESARREGIGARLLAAAEDRLRDAGIASAELSLDIDFDAPTAFLRRTHYARTTNGYGKTLQPDEA
jgi:GNAT superfamily N-acetyltransferase